jgi:hypothetical protein
MRKLHTRVLNKCPASSYHEKSAELSDAIKDMELWFQGVRPGDYKASRKLAPMQQRT